MLILSVCVSSEMKFICLTLMFVSGITDSRSEQNEVVGPADPVLAVAGEDVILPCSVKPSFSVVDMRVEWFRPDLEDSQVHLYVDHKDKNTDQIQSYRGRTKLNHQELQRGNASLKLSSVRVSDEGRYKCFIESKSWYDDATVNVRVEAVGSPPVITVDGFDHSGGLHLQCESEGWNPEPDLEWLDSEGVSLDSGTTETHRNTDGFSLKNTITVHHSGKIHCRVKMKHHMLETLIDTSNNMFNSWRTSVIMISVFVVLSVIAGILIAVFAHKYREQTQLRNEKNRIQDEKNRIQNEKNRIQHERDQLLQSQKIIIPKALTHLRSHRVNVILDADSAHPHLIVSDDGKQVKNGNRLKEDGKDRFSDYLGVLGKDGFSSGSFYFEVQVKGQTEWDLGVARESCRKSVIRLSPEYGYWTVGLEYGEYRARDSSYVPLSLTVNPQRVGVFVDYEKRLVSFYDVESMTHIYTFTVNVILDADSAHPHLIVSDDGKQVKNGNRLKEDGKDRFSDYLGVLGKDGFSSGSFYFEVQVKGQTEWDLGVARESCRKSVIRLSPEYGYWTVGLEYGEYRARDSSYVPLSLTVNPQRVGVFVDYEKRLVSFYDVESMTHIYTFTGQSFTGKLYPFVCLGYQYNENSTPLIICDDY
ncbi:butyrophilin subfamily 2 member A1-like isoform X2 [Chanodichthys erythropterus]|uniref:butyrophilin subfamily 2 member A1-like isoform X2 n=1 Tax=Chanodichthys erythropterus TaxID=933992 RepID=UPI00351DB7FC